MTKCEYCNCDIEIYNFCDGEVYLLADEGEACNNCYEEYLLRKEAEVTGT